MHREIVSGAPGECPICGMALQPSESDPVAQQPLRAAVLRQQGLLDVARRRIFSLPMRGPAWLQRNGIVRSLLHDDEVAVLLPGERGLFHPASASDPPLRVRLAGSPPGPWDASTSAVDFYVEGAARGGQIGRAGWLELAARPRAFLVVPATAVLQSSDGPYVLALTESRRFSRRPIRLGRVFFGLASVVSGLEEQELVAVRGAFFLDARARLEDRPGSPQTVDR